MYCADGIHFTRSIYRYRQNQILPRKRAEAGSIVLNRDLTFRLIYHGQARNQSAEIEPPPAHPMTSRIFADRFHRNFDSIR